MFYEVLGNEPVDARKRSAVKVILGANERKENFIITCVITHLEVLPSKLEQKGANDEEDYLSLFDSVKFGEIELSTNIVLRAREIRDFYYIPADAQGEGHKMMDLGDAIHLSAASIHGAAELHTRDNDKKGKKIPLLKLYEMFNNPKLCGKYDLKIVSPEADQAAFDLDAPKEKPNGG